MKYLLFSDLHCNLEQAKRLVQSAEEVDFVIAAGDLGNLRKNLKQTIDVLSAIQKPTILVPGNSESFEELKDACCGWASSHVLHGTGFEWHGIQFWGLGGGIPTTPFGSWSYDFTEDEARILLADCPTNSVLISHSPPKGILDKSSRGLSLGSVAVRDFIRDHKPSLVVCGHIHESSGTQERIESTLVVNAGPLGQVVDIG